MFVGKVDALWRYPIKSMGGESVCSTHIEPNGLVCDRKYTLENRLSGSKRKQLVTARQIPELVLYKANYSNGDQEKQNLTSRIMAQVFGSPAEAQVSVLSPSGDKYDLGDPEQLNQLGAEIDSECKLVENCENLVDCYPVSLISNQTVNQLSLELGRAIDKRRFRANIFFDSLLGSGFPEDSFVGKTIRIGNELQLDIIERDERCKIVSIDPENAEVNTEILKHIFLEHGYCAGIYANIRRPGKISVGDDISLEN